MPAADSASSSVATGQHSSSVPWQPSWLPPENVPAYQGLQQLCSHRYFGIRGNADCVAHLVPFAQPIHRSRPSGLHAFRYPLAPIDGVRPLHRAGSSADQLRERHARRLHRGGNGSCPEHPADDLCHAFGIAFAIQVCHIDNFVKDLTMTPHHEYWEFAIAAAVSAMGFSTIFSIPRRLLPVVAVGGIIAVCFRNFVNLGPSNATSVSTWA